MSVTVRTASAGAERWQAIPGDTRWIDYSCQQVGDDLVVYAHTFRRARERHDGASDVLFWRPGTTSIAREYAAGEWLAVVDVERAWPPAELTRVPGRRPAR